MEASQAATSPSAAALSARKLPAIEASAFDESTLALSVNVNYEQEDFICDLCGAELSGGIAEYEQHYQSQHVNVCRICKGIYPSQRLLDLHIQEIHDFYFQEMASRRNKEALTGAATTVTGDAGLYQCLLEPQFCGATFRNKQLRREHMISVHAYPPDYPDYFKVDRDFATLEANRLKRKQREQEAAAHAQAVANGEVPMTRQARRREKKKQRDVTSSSTTTASDTSSDDVSVTASEQTEDASLSSVSMADDS